MSQNILHLNKEFHQKIRLTVLHFELWHEITYYRQSDPTRKEPPITGDSGMWSQRLGRLRQKDHKFKGSLGNLVRLPWNLKGKRSGDTAQWWNLALQGSGFNTQSWRLKKKSSWNRQKRPLWWGRNHSNDLTSNKYQPPREHVPCAMVT